MSQKKQSQSNQIEINDSGAKTNSKINAYRCGNPAIFNFLQVGDEVVDAVRIQEFTTINIKKKMMEYLNEKKKKKNE